MDKIKEAQSHIEGLEVAEMGIQFAFEFRGTYPEHILANMMTVGPMQSFIGLAIKSGHLVPGPEVAELREQLATARAALKKIADWDDFPSTGRFWPNNDGSNTDSYRPMSYGACFGSNGERDFMRSVALTALGAA